MLKIKQSKDEEEQEHKNMHGLLCVCVCGHSFSGEDSLRRGHLNRDMMDASTRFACVKAK